MNTIEYAQRRKASPLLKRIAASEHQELTAFLANIASGKTVVLKNHTRDFKNPCAVGKNLRTKVNVNIGASTDISDVNLELKKLSVAQRYGADTVMDLTVGKNISTIRKRILANAQIPVGTVPIYEVAQRALSGNKQISSIRKQDFIDVMYEQARQGVDFFTVHAGITREIIEKIPKLTKKRIIEIVSRGGAILAQWIRRNKQENPLYEYFDDVLLIAKEYDITLSLGDGLRPGSVLDATDAIQLYELRRLGELAQRALKEGVQVIIEGPGHVPLNQIEKNIKMQKRICHGAPFYVLGPLVTDVASGYDHITAAIGGTLASYYGADFLCYVTAAEHLKLPSIQEVKEGLIASKIAAHAADIAKGLKHEIAWDREMSLARKKRDWQRQIQLSIDPEKARVFRRESKPSESSVCTMCGNYCSIKMIEDCFA